MNIQLIKKEDTLFRIDPVGNYIAEYHRDKKRVDQLHIKIYDPNKCSVTEISPDQRKVNFIELINCIYNCNALYYATCDIIDNSRLLITIYRYDPEIEDNSEICSFIKNIDILLNNDKRVRVFVLSESFVLMQTETHRRNANDNAMGSIDFSLTLYNMEAGIETQVTEGNFINNGINTICPVSDSKIMIKTGYSFVEDYRLDKADEQQSFIESVYVTTVSQFIADISLTREFMDMPLVDSAYMSTHITKPSVTGDYTHFCIVDPVEGTSRCIFYHNETGDRIEYMITGFDPDDLYVTYVIEGIPYVRKNINDQVTFINLNDGQNDIVFYENHFDAQIGKIFILSSANMRKSFMHIYAWPKLKRLISDRMTYAFSCQSDNNYYIYY